MTTYALVLDGTVTEVRPLPLSPATLFHADLADRWHAVPGTAEVKPGWTYDDSTFAAPVVPIGTLREARRVALRAACTTYLLAGFPCDALGTVHTYGSDETSQRNLASDAATASSGPYPVWCKDGDTWSFAPHSAAQLRQLAVAWTAYRIAAQQRLAGLLATLEDASTAAAIQAVTW